MSDARKSHELSPARRALLQAWREGRLPGARAGTQPPAADTRPPVLSAAQERILFFEELAPGTATQNLWSFWRLDGALDRDAMERAIHILVRRHDALRTSFPPGEDGPAPVVHASAPVRLVVIELDSRPDALHDEALRQAGRLAHEPFDLARGPLVRAALLHAGEHTCWLLLVVHHAVFDGGSLAILLRELGALYRALEDGATDPILPPLPACYSDIARAEQDALTPERTAELLRFWERELAGELPALALPGPQQPHRGARFAGSIHRFHVPGPLVQAVERTGRDEGVTPFVVLLTAFHILLYRFGGSSELVIGTPISRRARAALAGVIGPFINTLALRTRLGPETPFRAALRQVSAVLAGGLAHAELPFQRVVEAVRAGQPIFQAMFIFQGPAPADLDLGRVAATPVDLDPETAEIDLTLEVASAADGMRAAFRYRDEVLDSATARRLADGFVRLLARALAQPDTRIAELPVLGQDELQRVLVTWNQVAAPRHRDDAQGDICAQLACQARRRPDSLALRFINDALTHAELDRRASSLAGALLGLGVGPDRSVALLARRSLDMVVGMVAVLKAGGAYLPLDPAWPRARLRYMLEDSGAAVLLVDPALRAHIGPVSTPALDLAPSAAGVPGPGAPAPPPPGAAPPPPGSLAYVMYTSGSTGAPKAVTVTHANLSAYLEAMDRIIEPGERATWLAVTTIAFDISVQEILWPLARGLPVVLAPAYHAGGARAAGPGLGELMRRHAITHLQCTPAFARALLYDDEVLPALGSLQMLLLGGEACTAALVQDLRRWTAARILNVYGPTEATIWASSHEVTEARDPIPIGRPLAHAALYVLDQSLQPVPAGVTGELYIGGAGVVRGYHGRPALTAERFIPDPFGATPGARLYRTGDLARHRPDGSVEFLGRTDSQVKLRGFRIELGEIEAALARHPGVRHAAVVLREDAPGDARLVAYVSPRADALSTDALRAFVRERLPEYMVPGVWVTLAALPLTASGKIDRRALPAPAAPGMDEAPAPPRTPTEALVARIWAEVLGARDVDRRRSFFDLGGHSLLAAQVMARLRRELGADLPLQLLFDAPTLADLCAQLDAHVSRSCSPGDRVAARPIEPQPPGVARVLSAGQEQLWLLDRIDPHSSLYNHDVLLRLRGALDVAALRRALAEVSRRHESLRTVFRAEAGRPVPVVRADGGISLVEHDLGHLPAAQREARCMEAATREASRPFDLSAGPLARAILYRLGEHDFRLLLVVHHIVWDGWSAGVLSQELAQLYAACHAEEPASLSALPVQYTDYAAWQHALLRGPLQGELVSFWRAELADVPLLDLPTDRRRPAGPSAHGAIERVHLPDSLVHALEALGRRQGATLFMVLLAALYTLLYRHSGQEDICVGAPVAGRPRPELEGLIGYFVNVLVLRGDLRGQPSFVELLGRVRERALGAYAHQDLPLARLVAALAPDRQAGHSPLFQVMFILQNAPLAPLRMPGIEAERLEMPVTTARFDLTLMLEPVADGLRGWLSYRTALFDAGSIARLVAQYRILLERVAAQPDVGIADISLLTEAEARALARKPAPATAAGDVCLHEQFAAHAAATPDATAVTLRGRAWTYAQLHAHAGRIAHALARMDIRHGAPVAVLLDTSLEQAAAFLGVLAAGHAAVFLDVSHPDARLRQIVADLTPACLLSEAAILDARSDLARALPVLDLAAPGSEEPAPAGWPARPVQPEDLAYIAFTSGSTGTPKGIEQTHRSFRQFLDWQARTFGLGPGQRIAVWSPITYDACYCELLGALCHGATACLVPPELRASPRELAGWLQAERITWFQTVPSFAAGLLDTLRSLGQGAAALPQLTHVLLSGEVVPVQLARAWLAHFGPRPRLVNLYGPSEAVLATWHPICDVPAQARSIPVGQPVDGRQLLILDERQRPCPAGARGEIYIRSPYLTRGYHRRSEETRRVFLANPLTGDPNDPVYRTGDMGRWLPDGNLEFLGRVDHLVKIRGNRVELAEIESVLAGHDAVSEAVLVLRAGHGGDARLVAYVVAAAPIDASALRDFLAGRLPDYMVPAQIVLLNALPRTPTGKIDRQALPEPPGVAPAPAAAPLAAGTERIIAGIWRQVLGAQAVGREDSFFDLGGHSLLLAQVQDRLEQALQRSIPMLTLFRYPTVAALARHLDALAPPERSADDARELAQRRHASLRELRARRGQARRDTRTPPGAARERDETDRG